MYIIDRKKILVFKFVNNCCTVHDCAVLASYELVFCVPGKTFIGAVNLEGALLLSSPVLRLLVRTAVRFRTFLNLSSSQPVEE